MNYFLILLVLCQTTTVFTKSKDALARFLNSKKGLFDNVKFPEEDSQSGRGWEDNIEKLKGLLIDNGFVRGMFGNFKKLYRSEAKRIKEYDDDERHLDTFQRKLISILQHNFQLSKTYEKAINEFTDMDIEEIVRYKAGFIPAPENSTVKGGRNVLAEIPRPPPLLSSRKEKRHHKERFLIQNGRRMPASPPSKDWRTLGVVSPVKNQNTCGSCTLFATANALESSWYLWHGGLMLDLSEQELLDCIPPGNGHSGCQGNSPESTYGYLQTHGVGLESLNPYLNAAGQCQFTPIVAHVTNFFRLPSDEQEIKKYLALFGPVTGAIHINDDVIAYSSGIFSGDCSGELNHSILIVGYGTENGRDYWIIKNSWGTTWGEDGFFRILRGQNECGIANYVFVITA